VVKTMIVLITATIAAGATTDAITNFLHSRAEIQLVSAIYLHTQVF
jgi:hypothetical protein